VYFIRTKRRIIAILSKTAGNSHGPLSEKIEFMTKHLYRSGYFMFGYSFLFILCAALMIMGVVGFVYIYPLVFLCNALSGYFQIASLRVKDIGGTSQSGGRKSKDNQKASQSGGGEHVGIPIPTK